MSLALFGRPPMRPARLMLSLAAALAGGVACQNENRPAPPSDVAQTGGRSGRGGSAGRNDAGMMAAGSGGQSGSDATGGAVGSGGAGGSAGAAGGEGGSAPGDAGGVVDVPAADAAGADAPGTPPADVAPAADLRADGPAPGETAAPPDVAPIAACKSSPGPDAANLKLAFRPIELVGLPTAGGAGKNPIGLTELRFVPGTTDQFLLAQKGGSISHFRLVGDRATLVRPPVRVPGVFADEDCGLVSFAFDPGFVQNRRIHAAYCTGVNRSKVTRFTLGEAGLTEATDILSLSAPGGNRAWHSIGSVGFDRDGNLWLLHGEFTDATNAQNPSVNLGKLLRLRPRATGGFDPAPGNAFAGDASKSPLVYALGFRSPWKGYLDDRGRFLVGDVGPSDSEELNLVTKAGQNFGWNRHRGPCSGDCAAFSNPLATYRVANDPFLDDTDPRYENRQSRAVWVGLQYKDCGNDRYGGAMTGVYLWGDWYTGWVRGAVIDDGGRKTIDRSLAAFPGLTSWDQAPDGFLYAAKFGAYGTGELSGDTHGVFRVERLP